MVETWVCNPTNGFEDAAPWSSGSELCVSFGDWTLGETWWIEGTAGPSPLCDPSLGGQCGSESFQTAEVIQERPGYMPGKPDYPYFPAFNFELTGAMDDFATYTESFGGPSAWDPFTTAMSQIGSVSHGIGGSCITDGSDGVCFSTPNATQGFVRVWWLNHN